MSLPFPTYHDVELARQRLTGVIQPTALEHHSRLSDRYQATVYLKREDQQVVRSYKIRGAYNLMSTLSPEEQKAGIVCASAGNHAQGVALSCRLLKIQGHIFMPQNTPRQKIARTRFHGGDWVKITLVGDTFDATKEEALTFCHKHGHTFVHPFDDPRIIAGQGTIGLEILEQLGAPPDVVVAPVGGGGLASGLGLALKEHHPKLQLIGAEPAGCPSMQRALEEEKPVTLPSLDTFVDGAAVGRAGDYTWSLCQRYLDRLVLVPEGKVCTEMIDLYQNEGLITEPAGALAISALDELRDTIRGKTVVCIVSGSNNDLARYTDVVERSLVYQNVKHYFLINFSQRAGILRRFVNEVLSPTDDITIFEYIKKTSREFGPALVGIEQATPADYPPLLAKMQAINLDFEVLDPQSATYRLLI